MDGNLRALEKHEKEKEQEQNEAVSECCGAEIEERIDCDECIDCEECCRTITRGEYSYNKRQEAHEDRHDV